MQDWGQNELIALQNSLQESEYREKLVKLGSWVGLWGGIRSVSQTGGLKLSGEPTCLESVLLLQQWGFGPNGRPYPIRLRKLQRREPPHKEAPPPPDEPKRKRATGGSAHWKRNQIDVRQHPPMRYNVMKRLDEKMAVAYIRVSTEDQKLGLEAQRMGLGKWARDNDVKIAAWCVDDGVSGSADIGERPGLQEAIGLCRANRAGMLLIAKRDRLARSVYVAAVIQRHIEVMGCRIVCADGSGNGTTPADEFMRVILDGAAAYELSLIKHRTRAALQEKKRQRKVYTRLAPYGWELVGDGYFPNAHECGILFRVREMAAEGYNPSVIATHLTKTGKFSRAGTPFGYMQIHRMLHGSAAGKRATVGE